MYYLELIVISLEMLPAAHGDSLWIEYGPAGKTHRILIDGGPAHTYEAGLRRRIAALPIDDRIFELMVITHIDADHIDGMIILLQDKDTQSGLQFKVNDLWFNGWNQIAAYEAETYAPLQGEFLGGLITNDPKLRQVWNRRFSNGQEAASVPDSGDLPEIELEGGAKITLLGPAERDLRRLRARWKSAIRDFDSGDMNEALRRLKERRDYKPPATPAVFSAHQYGSDRSPANGSSISFVLEYQDVSLLLVGDAHARTLEATIGRLAAQRSTQKLRFDAVKLPHHGSMGNVSEAWVKMIDCERWLISTNGAIFEHPDIETVELIARCCEKKPTIFCNYQSVTTNKLIGSNQWNVIFPKGKSLGPVGGMLLKFAGTAKNPVKGRKGKSIG